MMSTILILCRFEWDSDDDTWTPDMDFDSVSSSDVDEIEDEDLDPDYMPTIHVNYVLQIIIHFNSCLDKISNL